LRRREKKMKKNHWKSSRMERVMRLRGKENASSIAFECAKSKLLMFFALSLLGAIDVEAFLS
jgi:hypothetical protein